jgi:hypothetical protein
MNRIIVYLVYTTRPLNDVSVYFNPKKLEIAYLETFSTNYLREFH